MSKSLEERAVEALPCEGMGRGCTLSMERTTHWRRCPAHYRPAVLAALRELREECAAEAEIGYMGRANPPADRIRHIGEPESPLTKP